MPTETTNLKLKCYDPTTDKDEKVYDFISNVTGTSNSNMTIIDKAIGSIQLGYLPLAGGTMLLAMRTMQETATPCRPVTAASVRPPRSISR